MIRDIFLKYETHSSAHVTFCTFKSVNSGDLYIIYFKTQNIHCIIAPLNTLHGV